MGFLVLLPTQLPLLFQQPVHPSALGTKTPGLPKRIYTVAPRTKGKVLPINDNETSNQQFINMNNNNNTDPQAVPFFPYWSDCLGPELPFYRLLGCWVLGSYIPSTSVKGGRRPASW